MKSPEDLLEAIEADKARMDADLTPGMRDVLRLIGRGGRKTRWKAGRSWPAYRGLEARGYVRRTEEDEDGRPTYALTLEGERAYERMTRPRVELVSAGERTRAWLETAPVQLVLADARRALLSERMTKDPREGAPAPPSGFVWPSLLAARLESLLRAAFPEEEISVRPYRR